jgi:LacI family transcriptional regulator
MPSKQAGLEASSPRAVDVAAAAGVSTATVSRTFNAPDKVLPAVRQRVLAAAASLGWMPHAAGRALASNRTYIAGAVIPMLDYVFAPQIDSMQAAFANEGITLFLGNANYDETQALNQVRAMLGRGVEALAIVGESHKAELFEALTARHVPYVVTYSYRPGSPHPCIGFDNREAYRVLTRHLFGLGHRIFGLIIQPVVDNDRVAARLTGIKEALAEWGLALRPQHIREGPWSINFGRESLRAILSAHGPRPTAIICGNDYLAIGALLEARAMGVDVPRQLSITGFDDVAMAEHTDPPLTTMRVPSSDIGQLAANYLLARLAGKVPDPLPVLVPDFIERHSIAPVDCSG